MNPGEQPTEFEQSIRKLSVALDQLEAAFRLRRLRVTTEKDGARWNAVEQKLEICPYNEWQNWRYYMRSEPWLALVLLQHAEDLLELAAANEAEQAKAVDKQVTEFAAWFSELQQP